MRKGRIQRFVRPGEIYLYREVLDDHGKPMDAEYATANPNGSKKWNWCTPAPMIDMVKPYRARKVDWKRDAEYARQIQQYRNIAREIRENAARAEAWAELNQSELNVIAH